MFTLIKTLVTYPNTSELKVFKIQYCYDDETYTTSKEEKIKLASINTPELRGIKSDPIAAKTAKDSLKDLLSCASVSIKQISKEMSKEK